MSGGNCLRFRRCGDRIVAHLSERVNKGSPLIHRCAWSERACNAAWGFRTADTAESSASWLAALQLAADGSDRAVARRAASPRLRGRKKHRDRLPFAEGKAERLPDLAAELVRLKPDVIFAYGGDVAPHVKKATGSIPIVALVSNDPVQSGLVASIPRPGSNITGITLVYDELAGKVIELLKEAVPAISRVAVLWNPDHADPEFQETRRAATALGVQLQSLEVRQSGDFDAAFNTATKEHAEGLIIISTRLLLQRRQPIVEFGTKNRIIMAGNWSDWVKDGFLLTYGPNPALAMRRIAVYVDKVLKGTRPADLPVEQPTKFELVINLKTAKALGLVVPQSLLARADEVIE